MGRYQVPGCEEGRPTAGSLTRGFGFPAPPPFVALVQAIWDVADARAEKPWDVYTEILTRPGGASARYDGLTPPELFPFADTGSDGEHYGYLIHAPELPATDWPVGTFVPGPSDGVCYLGRTTAEAVENVVAYWHRDELPAEVADVLARLGLSYDSARADRVRWLEGSEYVRLVPDVPAGWRHVQTSDGVGVLAPADAFGPTPPKVPPSRSPPERYVAAARRAEHPADRLVILKEGRDHADGSSDELLDALRAAYRALGREAHAEAS